MNCPKCNSNKVTFQVANEITEKKKKGVFYWIFIGWWWELFAWIFLTLPKLIIAIFSKKTKTVSKMKSYAVCQDCGHRWVFR